MQRKLNDEFIREYSEEFSEKITSEFFAEKERITGKEILNVSPSKQVNFFILKILFRKWQEEMKRLESPFFNYKNPDVRKAMVQFMNTLSQHIEVTETYFSTMAEEAVADTLLLAMDPGSYLSLEFEEMDVVRVTEKMTKPVLKYIKLHHENIADFFVENEGVDIDEFTERAEQYFEEVEVQSVIQQQVDELSLIIPLAVDDLYYQEESHDLDDDFDDLEIEDSSDDDDSLGVFEEISQPESESYIDEPDEISNDTAEEEDQHGGSYFDESHDSEDDESIEESDSENESEEEDDFVEKEPEPTADVDEDESDDTESLNQKYAEKSPTINDRYSAESNTVADKLDKKPVNTIMEAISVNHRYMFTKELFDGDRDAFIGAMEEIEKKESFDEAVEALVQGYAHLFAWDMNSDEVKELLKVVFRRFR